MADTINTEPINLEVKEVFEVKKENLDSINSTSSKTTSNNSSSNNNVILIIVGLLVGSIVFILCCCCVSYTLSFIFAAPTSVDTQQRSNDFYYDYDYDD